MDKIKVKGIKGINPILLNKAKSILLNRFPEKKITDSIVINMILKDYIKKT